MLRERKEAQARREEELSAAAEARERRELELELDENGDVSTSSLSSSLILFFLPAITITTCLTSNISSQKKVTIHTRHPRHRHRNTPDQPSRTHHRRARLPDHAAVPLQAPAAGRGGAAAGCGGGWHGEGVEGW